jgi:Type I phosphodiesterase / nucleotide pyrophosphatase
VYAAETDASASLKGDGMTAKTICAVAAAIGVFAASSDRTTAISTNGDASNGKAAHVLLLSIDGFHQFDLERYATTHPGSALARLVARGTEYTGTTSSRPSDSFPGTLAMTTGGSPSSTGIYYDVTWDDLLSPPGSACATRGAVAPFDGAIDVDDTAVTTSIDPTKLPLDPDRNCSPVYPHDYLKVNTIFEVIRAAGMRTAVSDKHPSYELLNGPSGTGVDDLFTPENDANGAKKDIAKMEAYDETKVQAVLNQIDGFDHARATYVGVPAIIMMNFQAANIGEKVGGYADAAGTPTAALAGAFDYVDGAIDRMLAELEAQDLTDSTLVIVTAKHANAPVDLSTRRAIDPALIDATIESVQLGLLAHETPDSISLIWLTDHSRAAEVAQAIAANPALAAETVYVGDAIKTVFDGTLAFARNRRPDVIVQPQPGVIYTTTSAATKKVEHGGFTEENTHVPLVVAGPGVAVRTVHRPVDLRQVAPTVLKALGLKPNDLDAVRREHTHRLPVDDDSEDDQ